MRVAEFSYVYYVHNKPMVFCNFLLSVFRANYDPHRTLLNITLSLVTK